MFVVKSNTLTCLPRTSILNNFKVLLMSVHLNGHTLIIYVSFPSVIKEKTKKKKKKRKSITLQYLSVAFIWMVTHWGFIDSLKTFVRTFSTLVKLRSDFDHQLMQKSEYSILLKNIPRFCTPSWQSHLRSNFERKSVESFWPRKPPWSNSLEFNLCAA